MKTSFYLFHSDERTDKRLFTGFNGNYTLPCPVKNIFENQAVNNLSRISFMICMLWHCL